MAKAEEVISGLTVEDKSVPGLTKEEEAIAGLTTEGLGSYKSIHSMLEDAVTANGKCVECSTAQSAPGRLALSVALGRATPKGAADYAARLLGCEGIGHIGAAQTCNIQPLSQVEQDNTPED